MDWLIDVSSNVFTIRTLVLFLFIGSCWSVGHEIQYKRYARAGLSIGIAITLLIILVGKPQINIQNDVNTYNHYHDTVKE